MQMTIDNSKKNALVSVTFRGWKPNKMIIDPFKLFIISIIKIVFRFFDWFYKLRMKKGKLLDEENNHWNC